MCYMIIYFLLSQNKKIKLLVKDLFLRYGSGMASSIVLFIIRWRQSSSFRKDMQNILYMRSSCQDLIKNSLKELKIKNFKLYKFNLRNKLCR